MRGVDPASAGRTREKDAVFGAGMTAMPGDVSHLLGVGRVKRSNGGDRGTGPKGLADECMAKGYEIKVAPAKDPTVAKDVYLPTRKPK